MNVTCLQILDGQKLTVITSLCLKFYFWVNSRNDRFLFSCHLDDRRGLFVQRDFSSHTRRNDCPDAVFCPFHIVPNENWIATRNDENREKKRRQ